MSYYTVMHPSDWTLIQACRRGDADAWEAVLDKYERLVYAVARSYTLPEADAADIVQLTFTILLQSLDAFDENVRLGGWLATVARRHVWRLLDRYRRETVRDFTDEADPLGRLPDSSGQTPFHQLDRRNWLLDGFAALDERCQQLLHALYFDSREPSYREVADLLQMPVGSVGPTRARCLEKLRGLLK